MLCGRPRAIDCSSSGAVGSSFPSRPSFQYERTGSMSHDRIAMTLMRIAVILIFLFTFLLAGIDKWNDGGAPDWFVEQFSETWMGSMPQTPMYIGLALLETIIAIAALPTAFIESAEKTNGSIPPINNPAIT